MAAAGAPPPAGGPGRAGGAGACGRPRRGQDPAALARALPAELAQALAAGHPLVVMVSLHGCPWCKVVREHYLAPMHADEGLPVVQVDWGSAQATQTVDGTSITHGELARAWKIKLAPTVLFLGAGGAGAERLEGGAPDLQRVPGPAPGAGPAGRAGLTFRFP
jgi:hypothetical protein